MSMRSDLLLRRLQALAAIGFLASLGLYAVWPWLPLAGGTARPRTLVFYGFSILGETMNQRVFPAFQEEWSKEGKTPVEFISSFGSSGTVTNQVIMGVPAELALLSLELDASRIAAKGVIPPASWRSLPHGGVVNRTPFVILVRPGNPREIHDFQDLTRPGIGIVHPDPLTSGGANWAIVAEYGAGMRSSGDPEGGYNLLLGIWRNVIAQASSARAARTQFDNGFGDALITYEQEALWDKSKNKLKSDVVYPKSTILSEHTLVVIERNTSEENRELVKRFVTFLWTDEAQRIFIQGGFRSVEERLNEENKGFHRIEDPFLIEDLGGWEKAKKDIVDEVWKKRVLKELGR